MDRDIKIISKNLIKPKHKREHKDYEYYKYEVIKPEKESKSCVSFYEIPPHKANYPYHYHLQNEEIFYIISGKGILETPDGNKEITKGDIIVCPPCEKSAHRIINTSGCESLVYLDVDVINYPDIAYYPRSNKVGIILNGESSRFYKQDKRVEYYEGE